jgi:hypothetical protein
VWFLFTMDGEDYSSSFFTTLITISNESRLTAGTFGAVSIEENRFDSARQPDFTPRTYCNNLLASAPSSSSSYRYRSSSS